MNNLSPPLDSTVYKVGSQASSFLMLGIFFTFIAYMYDNIDDREGWWFLDEDEEKYENR